MFSVLVSGALLAQPAIDFNNYQHIKCAGEVPEDFQIYTRDRYNSSVRLETAHNHNKPLDEDLSDFLLQTDYSINTMLLGGKVLFGDTITKYLNRVADRILINDPVLRGKLHFYCLRSAEANAFCTRQGIVFVTLGLMAQLENEAQLAFILSHEIAHFERRHILLSYEQRGTVFNKNRAQRYNSYDEQIRSASDYNKEIELEADSLGLARFAKSGYDCKESIGSFFVLQFSELPFEDFPFKTDFMETRYMKLPRSLFLDSLRPINLKTDMDDDSYSTHPNLATRRKKLEISLSNIKNCGTEKFKEGEKYFLLVRKIARFECIGILLNSRQYAEAIYNAQVLQFEDPASAYLKLAIGKALYGMAKYKNHERYAETAGFYGKKEGNQQQCYYVYNTLKPAQMNMVALRYLYDLSLTDKSAFVIGMRDDLAKEAFLMHEITIEEMKKSFEAYTQDQGKTKADTITKKKENTQAQPADPNAFVSKYDKLRNEKQQQDKNDLANSKFHMLAFADVIDNPEFLNMYTKAEKSVPAKKVPANDDEEEVEPGLVEYKTISNPSSSRPDTTKGIGTDTIVFVEPFYYITNDEDGFKPLESETALLAFDSTLKVKAKNANINCSYLFPKDFASGDVEKYNDLAIVNDWLSEKSDHDEMEFIPSSTNRTTSLTRKYHTKYFCYNGITDYEKVTNYYIFAYDVTSGSAEYYKKVPYKYAPDKTYINNCILYTIKKVKTK